MKFLKSRVGSNFLELTLEKSIFFDATSSSFISSTSIDIFSDSILLSIWESFSVKLSFCFISSLLSSSRSILEFKILDSLALNKLVIKSRIPDGVTLNNIAIEIINENIRINNIPALPI